MSRSRESSDVIRVLHQLKRADNIESLWLLMRQARQGARMNLNATLAEHCLHIRVVVDAHCSG
jgi:hypothetical protein